MNDDLKTNVQKIIDDVKKEGAKLLDDFKKSVEECEKKIIEELSESKKEEK